jgi:Arc/MetJ family transcription regulator
MATQNLHLPDDLLAEVAAAAADSGKTPSELVTEAVRVYLEVKALKDLAARGRIYAERAGNPDPVKAVRDVRRGV